MPSITFTPELHNVPDESGQCAIRIRITQNRKHIRKNLGYAIEKKFWNAKKKEVRQSHPLHAVLNDAIAAKKKSLETEYLQAISEGKEAKTFSISKSLKPKPQEEQNFITYFRKHIEKIENGNHKSNARGTCNKLEKFTPNLLFKDINRQFLIAYEQHLAEVYQNSKTSIHNEFAYIRLVYNAAVKDEYYVPTSLPPFTHYSIKKDKVKRLKLNFEEIEMFEKLELPHGSPLWHGKNFFLLCYYLMGVRAISMIQLRWSYISGDRIFYDAAKGKKSMGIQIKPQAQAILDSYRPLQNTEFIFPYLQEKDLELDAEKFANRIKCIIKVINRKLGHISKMLNIDKKITTHIARHSFAYNARKKSGGDIYAVQKALGHGSISTTEKYFATDETIEADELSNLMFD
jgi:integrase/recombinase XerD